MSYAVEGANWKPTVSDNGIGKANGPPSSKTGGLGTSLLQALAQELDAQVANVITGTAISITHATVMPHSPKMQ